MIGIYSLLWEDQDLIYIGQSTTIERRFYHHKYELEHGTHYNYKLQGAYNNHGLPTFNVLEECSIDQLDTLEIAYINEFGSLNNGLNLVEGGGGTLKGINAAGAKHSKITILRVFSLLYKSTKTQADISRITGVPKPTIAKLAIGNAHLWLLEEYPKQYKEMLHNNTLRTKTNRKGGLSGKVYPTLVYLDGSEHNITTNVVDFCRTSPILNGIGNAPLALVLQGKKLSYKGFKLKDPTTSTTQISTRPTLIGPEGESYEGIKVITKFCKEHPILSSIPKAADSIARVLRGDQKEFKGFHL